MPVPIHRSWGSWEISQSLVSMAEAGPGDWPE